jgi:hypothetical protein
VSAAGVLAATVAAATLASATALAQQLGPVAQQSDEAPIGLQQPRLHDLSPGVAQDEEKMEPELDAIAKELEKIENKICRGC